MSNPNTAPILTEKSPAAGSAVGKSGGKKRASSEPTAARLKRQEKRAREEQAIAEYQRATAYIRNVLADPVAHKGCQGAVAKAFDPISVGDIRDLFTPEGVSKSRDGKLAPKDLLVERICQWVELGGVMEKTAKGKAKKEKLDPEAAYAEFAELCDRFSVTGDPGSPWDTSDMTSGEKSRVLTLLTALTVGKAKESSTEPTLRNLCIGFGLNVGGKKDQLIRRITDFLTVTTVEKAAVAWDRAIDSAEDAELAMLEARIAARRAALASSGQATVAGRVIGGC